MASNTLWQQTGTFLDTCNNVYIGSKKINKPVIGSKDISKIYVGNQRIYDTGTNVSYTMYLTVYGTPFSSISSTSFGGTSTLNKLSSSSDEKTLTNALVIRDNQTGSYITDKCTITTTFGNDYVTLQPQLEATNTGQLKSKFQYREENTTISCRYSVNIANRFTFNSNTFNINYPYNSLSRTTIIFWYNVCKPAGANPPNKVGSWLNNTYTDEIQFKIDGTELKTNIAVSNWQFDNNHFITGYDLIFKYVYSTSISYAKGVKTSFKFEINNSLLYVAGYDLATYDKKYLSNEYKIWYYYESDAGFLQPCFTTKNDGSTIEIRSGRTKHYITNNSINIDLPSNPADTVNIVIDFYKPIN